MVRARHRLTLAAGHHHPWPGPEQRRHLLRPAGTVRARRLPPAAGHRYPQGWAPARLLAGPRRAGQHLSAAGRRGAWGGLPEAGLRRGSGRRPGHRCGAVGAQPGRGLGGASPVGRCRPVQRRGGPVQTCRQRHATGVQHRHRSPGGRGARQGRGCRAPLSRGARCTGSHARRAMGRSRWPRSAGRHRQSAVRRRASLRGGAADRGADTIGAAQGGLPHLVHLAPDLVLRPLRRVAARPWRNRTGARDRRFEPWACARRASERVGRAAAHQRLRPQATGPADEDNAAVLLAGAHRSRGCGASPATA